MKPVTRESQTENNKTGEVKDQNYIKHFPIMTKRDICCNGVSVSLFRKSFDHPIFFTVV